MHFLISTIRQIDWWLLGAALILCCLGLFTMYSFVGENLFFWRQLTWIAISLLVFFLALIPDYRFLKIGNTTFYLYLISIGLLIAVLLVGEVVLGAQRRIDLGFFSLQPSDPAKLILIILLAKYFSKRHELIGDFKHIIISGLYTLGIVGLVFIQPDFGSAVIIMTIWFGMVIVAGIRFRHIAVVGIVGVVVASILWQFVFLDYQKQRVLTFLDPLSDIQGAGYNAYQSVVAVGSGQLFGKGVGYGTQSKLLFLPEYETDFIFAAYAEEWGFFGVIFLFMLFGIVLWRILYHALTATSNFEALFCSGVAIFLTTHFFVHIGMNIGVLPVTGTTVPFLSYGGSHLVTEFLAIGMVIAFASQRRLKVVSSLEYEETLLLGQHYTTKK
jgi:rod shape determining protein RodA